MKKLGLIIMFACLLLISCDPVPELPTVVIKEIKDVASMSAKVVFEITDDGGAEIYTCGVLCDTEEIPEDGVGLPLQHLKPAGANVYEWGLTEMMTNTTYYVRAFASNKVGMTLSEQMSFTTLNFGESNGSDDEYDSDGEINGYEYVDLGLPSGLKWATCNVGADLPSGFGDIFAWGEISPKDEYTSENCITMGVEFDDISGNPQYDAARANWGGDWRIPTMDEIRELRDNCMWERVEMNGIWGMKITGSNGKSIFLPSTFKDEYREYGEYMSSVPIDGYTNGGGADESAWGVLFYFTYNDGVEVYTTYKPRYRGHPIRPVID